jgi:tetratricopeptide (TPR) repeat protein
VTLNRDPNRPSLSELFDGYLNRQIEAQAQGLGYAEPAGEVVPHDATPMQPVDPKLAWTDALAPARYLGGTEKPRPAAAPSEWAHLVASEEPVLSLAFALGNFPQLVRNLPALLGGEPISPASLPTRALELPALVKWARQQAGTPRALLAAGILRLARHFDQAEELLAAAVPAGSEALAGNERAALAWHRGEWERALELWQDLPESVPVLFNRGMALLFLGHAIQAREALTKAAAGLPETSAWHHLARLYLALAALRGA